MKTYKSFKALYSVFNIAACHMEGFHDGHQYRAVRFLDLYVKNWKEGLSTEEWREAKVLIEFWKEESKKDV